jgi:O-succinylbenzoic acid--CoA ligase
MERAELICMLGAIPPPFTAGSAALGVVVAEREPARFMARFGEAVAARGPVFLADPNWGEVERAQFQAIIAQTPLPESTEAELQAAGGQPAIQDRGWLCIPTGGSSGNLRLARHDSATLAAAVRGFCTHFGVSQVNAVGLLPLHHVSGLMAWMRTVMTGGTYLPWSWKAVEAGERPALPLGKGDWFLSLVPTQLQRLLGNAEAEDWLRGFRAVFVGGGPAWPELIEASARARLPLAFAYGMTESAAMVTALRPEEFLAGGRGCGKVLAHAQLDWADDDGRIVLGGASLFRGYWPETRVGESWATEDLGRFDSQGSLHVLGRRDALIISGGEKVDPAEVEAALRLTGLFSDVVVVGEADTVWGEVVVACYPACDGAMAAEPELGQLAVYKRPKRYVAVPDWPRNAQGKVNRARLRSWLDAAGKAGAKLPQV